MTNEYAPFRNEFARDIFQQKYSHDGAFTWDTLADTLVEDVCGPSEVGGKGLISREDRQGIAKAIKDFKFIPGGRYLYYAGRPAKYYNNCYLLRAEEDTREEWSAVTWRAMSCLMTGGGIGIDYSRLRESGRKLTRTGGEASGPISLMYAINEIGRNVMQGGSRRSAIYASLDRTHPDIEQFLNTKNWNTQIIGDNNYTAGDAKKFDFNFRAPLDTTNISVNYKDDWLRTEGRELDPVFLKNVEQALTTGEPGFSFNFGKHENETLRNACTEVTSEDDSDVCNLGSINLGAVESLDEFRDIISLASKFLVCGTLRAHLPYEKVHQVRAKNRRLGLGLMGIHEWLMRRGHAYTAEPLLEWLKVYKDESERHADQLCDGLGISRPVAYRAIAPTGSIGILAGTTTGIEPLYAVAYKRRYLKGSQWRYQYVVDGVADLLINKYGLDPNGIETARDLANDPERRIKFQADVQDYVDMSISSTINLPSATNNDGSPKLSRDDVTAFAKTLSTYAPRLRGFTCYPDGARGGQPLTKVEYKDAIGKKGMHFEELDICDISGKGGTCGS